MQRDFCNCEYIYNKQRFNYNSKIINFAILLAKSVLNFDSKLHGPVRAL